jgi:hypothetical protein
VKNPQRFYTYAYLREDRTPYYIGKGQKNRAYQSSGKPCAVPKNKKQIIFLKTLLFEEEAYKHEKYMISVFGRKNNKTGILQNRTDGGEGGNGVIWTTEMKENKSIEYKNKNIKPPLQKGKRSWTNGIIQTISYESPGNCWYLGGLPKPMVSELNKERFIGRKWWNNGYEMKMVFECPGEGWFPGRIITNSMKKWNKEKNKGKKISKNSIKKRKEKMIGRKWWNNGQLSTLSCECPGEGWIAGRGQTLKKLS